MEQNTRTVAVKDTTVSPLGMRTGDRWDLDADRLESLVHFSFSFLFPYFTNIYLNRLCHSWRPQPQWQLWCPPTLPFTTLPPDLKMATIITSMCQNGGSRRFYLLIATTTILAPIHDMRIAKVQLWFLFSTLLTIFYLKVSCMAMTNGDGWLKMQMHLKSLVVLHSGYFGDSFANWCVFNS